MANSVTTIVGCSGTNTITQLTYSKVMSSEREFNLTLFSVKFKYLFELVKNLLEKQDRKVSIKLPHVKRILDGPERVVNAAIQSIVYGKEIIKMYHKHAL